jgi:hypothetical protein
MIDDLNALVPEQVFIKLRDRKSKEEYEVDLFMPGEIGLLYIEYEEDIQKLYTDPKVKGRFSKNTYNLIYALFEMMFKPQFSFMTAKWCRENIDFYSLLKILISMGKPIYDYLKTIGIVGTPEKNPQNPADQSQSNLPQ